MRQIFLLLFCAGMLLAGFLGPLGAAELEITGGVNNLTFHPDKMNAYTDPTGTRQNFQIYPFGFGAVNFRSEINNIMRFNMGLERDNILMNSLYLSLVARTDYFLIEFGPFVGMNDKIEVPNAGILGRFELTFPGICFLSVSGSSTLGSQFEFTSNNVRESGEVKLGIWIPKFLILSGSASIKRNSVFIDKADIEETQDLIRKDMLIRYQGSAEFYGKNSPLTLRLDGGYQTYSRNYSRENTLSDYTDEISGYFAGCEIGIQATRSWKITAGAEFPFFYTSKKPMTITENFARLFKAQAGFVFTFHGRDSEKSEKKKDKGDKDKKEE